jgi:two-component system CheB/CheR fusion protein
VIRRAADATYPQMEKCRHALALELPDEPLLVYGDEVRLEQVFGNLLTNAAKYMEDGGSITVRGAAHAHDPGRVTVEVIDQGTGVPPDMLEHIFEPFAQLRPEGSRKYSGLGIGLAIVRKLVDLHGGTVRAHSEGQNCGSRFVVDLPVMDPLPASPVVQEPAAAPVSLRVLVIDDNVDSAEALAQLLQRTAGHELCVRHDGASGIVAALEFRPDVILLDIGLPDVDGYEVARRIRSREELADTQIVAISGFSSTNAGKEPGFSGFNRYLMKPVSCADLERVFAEVGGTAPAVSR